MKIYVDADACPVIRIVERLAKSMECHVCCYAIHQSGKWYTNENIDQMLMERHIAKAERRKTKKHHLKGLLRER